MEKIITPRSGWFMLFVSLLLLAAAIVCFMLGADENPALIGAGVVVVLAFTVAVSGFIAIEPNSSRVLTLFGKYVGTVSSNGFFWVNPFFTKKKISLRANNLDTKPIKVNDKHGNPIMIGAVVVWKVENAYKAAFEVDNYQSFVETQSEAAIRKLAGAYAYDNFEHALLPPPTKAEHFSKLENINYLKRYRGSGIKPENHYVTWAKNRLLALILLPGFISPITVTRGIYQ